MGIKDQENHQPWWVGGDRTHKPSGRVGSERKGTEKDTWVQVQLCLLPLGLIPTSANFPDNQMAEAAGDLTLHLTRVPRPASYLGLGGARPHGQMDICVGSNYMPHDGLGLSQ